MYRTTVLAPIWLVLAWKSRKIAIPSFCLLGNTPNWHLYSGDSHRIPSAAHTASAGRVTPLSSLYSHISANRRDGIRKTIVGGGWVDERFLACFRMRWCVWIRPRKNSGPKGQMIGRVDVRAQNPHLPARIHLTLKPSHALSSKPGSPKNNNGDYPCSLSSSPSPERIDESVLG
jgi:hypothetical protein